MIAFMKWVTLLLLLALLAPPAAPGADDPPNLDELMRSAEQWAKDNLDDDALRVLEQVDKQKVNQFFHDLQQRFGGDNVRELAPYKNLARSLLPLLESYEETLPYALWLKTRLDYLDVAEQLRQAAPPPKADPGKAPSPAPNPKPQALREVWTRRVAHEPWPPAARSYVSKLKPIFAAHKIPAELVWIAEVESSFDPRARSPAGAAGLFQLMPATARNYGLRTWPFDQRLKPEASAEAAAKYLAHLHGQFKNWWLTLAAYNAGEGTVRNLLTKYKAHTFDAIATHLPAETQLYVPKIEAILQRREGVKLGQL
jgi:membrane-bound lytic murein transglycosylase D